jgi:hypothetical protein
MSRPPDYEGLWAGFREAARGQAADMLDQRTSRSQTRNSRSFRHGSIGILVAGHATTDTDIRFKSRFETSGEFHRETPPPTPRSEATVLRGDLGGNTAERATTAFVAPLIVLLPVRKDVELAQRVSRVMTFDIVNYFRDMGMAATGWLYTPPDIIKRQAIRAKCQELKGSGWSQRDFA